MIGGALALLGLVLGLAIVRRKRSGISYVTGAGGSVESSFLS